jgi:hypothetical protein
MTRKTTNMIRKIMNKTCAIVAAVPARVVKPSAPAIKATTRNVRAHPNILIPPLSPQDSGFSSYLRPVSSWFLVFSIAEEPQFLDTHFLHAFPPILGIRKCLAMGKNMYSSHAGSSQGVKRGVVQGFFPTLSAI